MFFSFWLYYTTSRGICQGVWVIFLGKFLLTKNLQFVHKLFLNCANCTKLGSLQPPASRANIIGWLGSRWGYGALAKNIVGGVFWEKNYFLLWIWYCLPTSHTKSFFHFKSRFLFFFLFNFFFFFFLKKIFISAKFRSND